MVPLRTAAPWQADVDGNGRWEPSDVAMFVSWWAGDLAGGTLRADFDGNGVVDPADVAAMVSAWLNAVANGC